MYINNFLIKIKQKLFLGICVVKIGHICKIFGIMEDIRQQSLGDLQQIFTGMGEQAFRAKQVYEWIWKKGVLSFDDMTNLSKTLREKLKKRFIFQSSHIATYHTSKDNTIKALLKLFDKNYIEGVLIPSRSRVTACISSQVGCAIGCKFCATGTMGFTRNLSCPEIFDQVFQLNSLANEQFTQHLTNIVIMGMGEPLQNTENVLCGINRITAETGLGISPKRITLSTVGIIKEIKKLADKQVKFNLAVSLHQAHQAKRESLVAAAGNNKLPELMKVLQYFYEKTGTRITFEYLLLHQVNDQIEDARQLAAYCKGIPCKINLITYNPVKDKPYKRSGLKDEEAFKKFLEQHGLIVNTRSSRGEDIGAACGQLAGRLKNFV